MQKEVFRWDDCGVALTLRTFAVGDVIEIPPQRDTPGLNPNVTMTLRGRLRWTNDLYPGSVIEFAGRPGKQWGGVCIPGTYKAEALEETDYACLSPYPQEYLQSNGIPDFEFIHKTEFKGQGDNITFKYEDGFRYIFIAWGDALIDGVVVNRGRRVSINPGESFTVSAETEYAEIVGYKLK